MKKLFLFILFILSTVFSWCQTYEVNVWDSSYFFPIDENTDIPRFKIKAKDGKYRIILSSQDTGFLYMSATVKKGNYNGPCQIFWENGFIKSGGYLSNGVKTGKWTYYNTSGQLIREEFLKENYRDRENYEIRYQYDVFGSLSSIVTIKGMCSDNRMEDTLFINPINPVHLKLVCSLDSILSNNWHLFSPSFHTLERFGGNSIHLDFISSETESSKGNCGASVSFIPKKYQEEFKKEKGTGEFLETKSYLVHLDYCNDDFPFWADQENKERYQKLLPIFLKEVRQFIELNYNSL